MCVCVREIECVNERGNGCVRVCKNMRKCVCGREREKNVCASERENVQISV